MIRSKIARFGGLAIGLSMIVGFASPAAALTVADLQAQIAALMAQLQSMQGGSASSAITSDLTVGSSGSQVVALQNTLIAQGYLHLPAGVAAGYFGGLTKAAVKAWQAASGLPATGFFGPLSRARFSPSNAGGTTTGGTVSTGGSSVAACSTRNEGSLNVTTAPVSSATVYVNDQKDPILAFNAKASGSDVTLQRLKIDVGANTTLTNKILSNVYLVDDQGNVLASSAVNSNTVVKESDNRYYLTLTGFSSVVPMSTQRTYTIKADIRSSIDSTNQTSYTVKLAAATHGNGVRAQDCAGLDLYSGDDTISKVFTVAASLSDSATLTVSTDAANPVKQEVVAASGSNNNQADKVPLLVFDIAADKDNVTLTDLIAAVTATNANGVGAAASTTYLMSGGQVLASASNSGTSVTFNNMSISIPKGTIKVFTLASDITGASAFQATFVASVTGNTTNVVATNGNGDTVTNVSGSATGSSILVRNVGPVITLNSKSLTYSPAQAIAAGTSSALASFSIHIQAVGSDLFFGTQSASSTFGFGIYKDGVLTVVNDASTTSYDIPSNAVTTGLTGANNFKVPKGSSVDVPVRFYFEGRQATGALITSGTYAVGLESVVWSTNGATATTTNFMSGRTEWRTNAIVMP